VTDVESLEEQKAAAPATGRERLRRVKRLVVKIGSSSLTRGSSSHLDGKVINQLAGDVAALRRQGLEVAIVSSGAVAAGMGRLGLGERPGPIADLQAAAAIGQSLLMNRYEAAFKRHGIAVGQVLLTAEDILDDRRRYLNLRNTFRSLFSFGAVPVINENDSVAVAELKLTIGENDSLAAYVANLVHAELLVILSDVEGLFPSYGREGPCGEVIAEVEEDTDIETVVGTSSNHLGRGGMHTKIRAARLLMRCGEMTVIAHARKHRLPEILAGRKLGTLFLPSRKRLGSRKRWIGFASPCKGSVAIDRGAERAIRDLGKSLLVAGVIGCSGEFKPGDVIRVENRGKAEVARGLTRYDSAEIARVLGKSSADVEAVLGRPAIEVIHRDDLVLF
jgi:glutamate 5-kinase